MYESRNPGDLIGRNMLTRSSVTAADDGKTVPEWHTKAPVAAKAGVAEDGGTGYRILVGEFTGSNYAGGMWQEITATPGAELTVTLRYRAPTTAGPAYVALWPVIDLNGTRTLVYPPGAAQSGNPKFIDATGPTTFTAATASLPSISAADVYATTTATLTVPTFPEELESNNFYTETYPVVGIALVYYSRVAAAGTSIAYIRLDYSASPVGGYFNGDTPDNEVYRFEWTADGRAEVYVAGAPALPEPKPVDPGPQPPEPEDPEPGTPPTDVKLPVVDTWTRSMALRVAAYIGKAGNARMIATAEAQIPTVATFVHGYTRGNGFDSSGRVQDLPLEAVIVSAAARLVVNPEQLWQYSVGDYSERPAVLQGWTLPEIAVLHRYRRRSR